MNDSRKMDGEPEDKRSQPSQENSEEPKDFKTIAAMELAHKLANERVGSITDHLKKIEPIQQIEEADSSQEDAKN